MIAGSSVSGAGGMSGKALSLLRRGHAPATPSTRHSVRPPQAFVLAWGSGSWRALTSIPRYPHPAKIPGRVRKHIITTLDPARLSHLDYLTLSEADKSPQVYDTKPPRSLSLQASTLHLAKDFGRSSMFYLQKRNVLKNRFIPFPNDTRGYLYYHRLPMPTIPALAGEIRFRLVSDPEKAWQDGHDLMLPDGSPWHVGIPEIAAHSRFAGFRALLLREGFLLAATLEDAAVLCAFGKQAVLPMTFIAQPFFVDFGEPRIYAHTRLSKARRTSGAWQWACDPRPERHPRRKYRPYTGSAVCQFVPVVSGTTDDYPYPSLQLRVVRILEPIEAVDPNYDGFVPEPVAGQLCHFGSEPWTIPLHPRHGGYRWSFLRELWLQGKQQTVSTD